MTGARRPAARGPVALPAAAVGQQGPPARCGSPRRPPGPRGPPPRDTPEGVRVREGLSLPIRSQGGECWRRPVMRRLGVTPTAPCLLFLRECPSSWGPRVGPRRLQRLQGLRPGGIRTPARDQQDPCPAGKVAPAATAHTGHPLGTEGVRSSESRTVPRQAALRGGREGRLTPGRVPSGALPGSEALGGGLRLSPPANPAVPSAPGPFRHWKADRCLQKPEFLLPRDVCCVGVTVFGLL